MTEPTTPTGKALSDRLAYDSSPEQYLPGDYLREYRDSILAIEAEARQQERRAIRAQCKERNPDHDDRWCRICTDMVDPVDDPEGDR